jgi:hypothetical protein
LRAVLDVNGRDGFAQVTLAATLMDRVEKQGARTALLEAKRLLDSAYAGGARGKVISAAYGRLKSLS